MIVNVNRSMVKKDESIMYKEINLTIIHSLSKFLKVINAESPQFKWPLLTFLKKFKKYVE